MRRFAFNLASVASLLFCAALLVLWGRADWAHDVLSFTTAGGTWWELRSDGSGVGAVRAGPWPRAERASQASRASSPFGAGRSFFTDGATVGPYVSGMPAVAAKIAEGAADFQRQDALLKRAKTSRTEWEQSKLNWEIARAVWQIDERSISKAAAASAINTGPWEGTPAPPGIREFHGGWVHGGWGTAYSLLTPHGLPATAAPPVPSLASVRIQFVHARYLPVALGTGLLPALWLVSFTRRFAGARMRRHRMRQGCCPECGYDLRANTGNACPECGATRSSAGVGPAAKAAPT